MTAFIEFFCNVCNPSAQRREEGDELTRGYERIFDGDSAPPGWREVPNLGPVGVGHVCDECVAEDRVPRQDDAPPTPEANDSGWPARTSPFGP